MELPATYFFKKSHSPIRRDPRKLFPGEGIVLILPGFVSVNGF